jgi:hypothetical protein
MYRRAVRLDLVGWMRCEAVQKIKLLVVHRSPNMLQIGAKIKFICPSLSV